MKPGEEEGRKKKNPRLSNRADVALPAAALRWRRRRDALQHARVLRNGKQKRTSAKRRATYLGVLCAGVKRACSPQRQ
jgi:hypothetical protein